MEKETKFLFSVRLLDESLLHSRTVDFMTEDKITHSTKSLNVSLENERYIFSSILFYSKQEITRVYILHACAAVDVRKHWIV